MSNPLILALLLASFCCFNNCVEAQSTFDLEPPILASESQATMSPDPDAIPLFRFATAELNEKGQIVIATKKANQTLLAPMPKPVDPEIDPRGIKYTENVTQNFTVHRVLTVKDKDGNDEKVTKAERRTRKVPVTRFRKRNAEEQKEFEKKVTEHETNLKENGPPKTAVATEVSQEYTVNIPERTVDADGNVTMTSKAQQRTRTITVYRGETKTTETIDVKTWSLDQVQCYDIAGESLDTESIKERLSERQPVILVSSKQGISPYFERLLNPEAILVVTPSK